MGKDQKKDEGRKEKDGRERTREDGRREGVTDVGYREKVGKGKWKGRRGGIEEGEGRGRR